MWAVSKVGALRRPCRALAPSLRCWLDAPCPENMLKPWASGAGRSAVMSLHMDKTPVRVLAGGRDGLYGLADLTCLATLIGGASRRPVDARRSGDEPRRAPSPASMNSTVSLLGECSRRRLTHLTLVTRWLDGRSSTVPAPATGCHQPRGPAALSTGITSYAYSNVNRELSEHGDRPTGSG